MKARLLGLTLAVGLAGLQPAVAQTATPGTGAPPPAEAPIAVEPSSPPGSSKDVAVGATIGVVVGIAVLVLLFSSGSSD
jgi:hypothetical protein